MNAVRTVAKELWTSIPLINRLAVYETKIKNKSNYLGSFWEIISPLLFIAIYWFAFGYGIRQRSDVDGIPFLTWMLAGIILWFFIQPGVTNGSKAIFSKIKMISKMNFPTSIIPAYVVISRLFPHLALLGITIVYMQFAGHPISVYYIQIPYFLLAAILLVISVVMITSTLTVIVRDFQVFIQSSIRVFLYLTPILWPMDNRLPDWLIPVMKINPMYYLVEGYRASFFYGEWYFITNASYTLYFWALVFVLFSIGAVLHVRFRRHFVDFL